MKKCKASSGFPLERLSSPGGGKSIHPPDPKPCFISPTNLSYSPPAEQDTCCLSPRAQETPSELPRWSIRPSPPPAAPPRCRSRPGVSLGIRMGGPPRCCHRGGRGLSDRTITHPTSPPPPHSQLTPCTRTHESWPLSTRGPSSARPWYPPTASDTIDQALPP